jgi:hypothetical protein
LGQYVVKELKESCPNFGNDQVTEIVNAVESYYNKYKGRALFTNLGKLYLKIKAICKNQPPPPAADISQGGMLGGIVRDSRCASGYAVSGTNNPNTGRPYCTQ